MVKNKKVVDFGVDKVYVISLKRHKLRRSSIKKQSKDWGFDYEFIDGIDNKKHRQDRLFKKNIHDKFWDPSGRCTLAILCCAMSHRKAYKAFLDSGAETALFLEDDIEITQRIYDYDFNDVRNELDALNWGICWYGKYVDDIQTRDKISKNLYSAEPHHNKQYAGHSYVLNRKSAQWFYNATKKIKYAADVRLEFSPFEQVTFNKSVFIQKHIHHYINNIVVEAEFMHSTLEDASWVDKKLVSKFLNSGSITPKQIGFKDKVLDGWEFKF